MSLMLLAAGTAGDISAPTRLDPLQLFMDADIVVQLVILGLVLASIWVWTIIVSFSLQMARVDRRSAEFDREFWQAEDPSRLLGGKKRRDNPFAHIAAAGIGELNQSTEDGVRDADSTRQRVALVMEGQVATHADDLANRLNFLATTGSVAPFVGLFGTVWGIMNSFFQIGSQQNASLAVVAPGISEALFATAIGLFAAIPAVIAYNRFSHRVNRYEARMQRFADRVHAQIGRELERG
jgi:biopolymer transport protein TolQ